MELIFSRLEDESGSAKPTDAFVPRQRLHVGQKHGLTETSTARCVAVSSFCPTFVRHLSVVDRRQSHHHANRFASLFSAKQTCLFFWKSLSVALARSQNAVTFRSMIQLIKLQQLCEQLQQQNSQFSGGCRNLKTAIGSLKSSISN